MFRMKILPIAILIMVTLVNLSACTPKVNLPGKLVVEPRFENGEYIARDGAVLPVRSWLPKDGRTGAVIVAVHGFNDYSNAFTYPGIYFSSFGIACYAYDQRGFGKAPGHGLWAGIDAYTEDLTGFAKLIQKRHPGIPLYIMGESMGGAVTIVAMTGNNRPIVDGIILVAPAVWGRDTMPWYQRWLLAITSHTVPWMKLTGDGLGVIPSDNIEMRRALGRDPLFIKATRIDTMYGLTNLMDEALSQAGELQLPTLIQYGKNDQVIPKEPTFLMLDKVPKTTRKAFYEHGYHMLLRDLQREKPMADIITWVADHNKSLPYGADHWQ